MKSTVTLEQIASFDSLMAAWKKVRANRGAAGLDRVTITQFEEDLVPNLEHLSLQLRTGQYMPLPPRYASILKPNGRPRLLGILAITDRIVQRAALDALEPSCEALFLDCSFGYRPGRSTRDAAKAVLEHQAGGCTWVVDADIEDFFDSLDHNRLLKIVGDHIDDPTLFTLFEMWLGDESTGNLDVLSRSSEQIPSQEEHPWKSLFAQAIPLLLLNKSVRTSVEHLAGRLLDQGAQRLSLPSVSSKTRITMRRAMGIGGAALLAWSMYPALADWLRRQTDYNGILQGAPISPLLANLYLHAFDQAMTDAGCRLVRYADDFVLLCRSQEEAQEALDRAAHTLQDLGLTLNPEKTRIVNISEGFEFLGYTFQGNTAQMGDDLETRLRAPLLQGGMDGLRQRVESLTQPFRAARTWISRRFFGQPQPLQIPAEEVEVHADALR